MIESRPWGNFEILLDSLSTKVKRITVKPGGNLSYQYHHKRAEYWVIISGTATVVLEGETSEYTEGQGVYIPKQAKHRVGNFSDTDLVFIEVQVGEYFGEDDIVRLEDNYNRV